MGRARRLLIRKLRRYFRWPRIVFWTVVCAIALSGLLVLRAVKKADPTTSAALIEAYTWTLIGVLCASALFGTLWMFVKKTAFERCKAERNLRTHFRWLRRARTLIGQTLDCEAAALAERRNDITADESSRRIARRLEVRAEREDTLLQAFRRHIACIGFARGLFREGWSLDQVGLLLKKALRGAHNQIEDGRARRTVKILGRSHFLAKRALAEEMKNVAKEHADALSDSTPPAHKLTKLSAAGIPETLAKRVIQAHATLDGRLDQYERSVFRARPFLQYVKYRQLAAEERIEDQKRAAIRLVSLDAAWEPDGEKAVELRYRWHRADKTAPATEAGIADLELCGLERTAAERRVRKMFLWTYGILLFLGGPPIVWMVVSVARYGSIERISYDQRVDHILALLFFGPYIVFGLLAFSYPVWHLCRTALRALKRSRDEKWRSALAELTGELHSA